MKQSTLRVWGHRFVLITVASLAMQAAAQDRDGRKPARPDGATPPRKEGPDRRDERPRDGVRPQQKGDDRSRAPEVRRAAQPPAPTRRDDVRSRPPEPRRDAGRPPEVRRDDHRAPTPAPAPSWGGGRPDDRGRFAPSFPPMPRYGFQSRPPEPRRDAGRPPEVRRDDRRAPAPAPRWGGGRPDDRGRFAQPPAPMPRYGFQSRPPEPRRDAGRPPEVRRDDRRAPAPVPRWGGGRPDDRSRFAQPPAPMRPPWFQYRR